MADQELTLADIAGQKAAILQQMAALEVQETGIRDKAVSDAHADLVALLEKHREDFTAKQKREIAGILGAGGAPKTTGAASTQALPKYRLPHNGETWSGRGRMPKAFAAWQGTVAYTEWKAQHPGLKFPACQP